MDIRIEKSLAHNPLEALHQTGYVSMCDIKTGKESFFYSLGAEMFPRFHLTYKDTGFDNTLTLSLHLDRFETFSEESHRHNAEYHADFVDKEMDRIRKAMISSTLPHATPAIPHKNHPLQSRRSFRWFRETLGTMLLLK